MKWTQKLLNQTAEQAKLDLTQEDEKSLLLELEKLTEFVRTAQTDETLSFGCKQDECNVFRKDEVQAFTETNRILQNAPLVKDNCFIVPNIV